MGFWEVLEPRENKDQWEGLETMGSRGHQDQQVLKAWLVQWASQDPRASLETQGRLEK